MNKLRDTIIKEWFTSWKTTEYNDFNTIFSKDIYYSESWGPEYYGVDEIKRWKVKWHTHSSLNEWIIKNIIHTDTYSTVEWYFSCNDKEGKQDFDGVSII
ncbi:MAG: hypothetical protein ACK5LC_10955, partial [Coprobacillaceae bacterium]